MITDTAHTPDITPAAHDVALDLRDLTRGSPTAIPGSPLSIGSICVYREVPSPPSPVRPGQVSPRCSPWRAPCYARTPAAST